MGGIGQQVADNLFELGQSTVKAATQAGGDIVSGTLEQLTGAPSGVGADPADKSKDLGERDLEQQKIMAKQKDNQRYQQVKAELDQYRQRRQELDAQIARERNQQEQEKQQKEVGARQKKESFVQSLLKKVGAGSHGETDKQKE
ncbi:MAG: hypothetical protein UX08_C0011G0003 [Candidatus Collierbacteria bacterium GW2011_GWB1_45_35]|uniref:Uncharacterized protein n=2 Tax=Candidatus Collieribacteriota TaxID=1752725 RepID=A0A0G1KQF9_9BACT|nr:MAG: hypothetical protein UW48_C0010G0016 [Microgenomates group bacterium GW2011_GWC1_44_23]KKT85783.1 MAG: hypothetical protein UW84_C0022G0015 [Candidatus Collierbacteria bacterium GW2011_GWA2_44_99]KKT94834.1 MAG: hypothetical protein UW96_C0014G0003 [Candidatus Collierbacteria bacterium GW2011_GWA1_45_15]KKT99662.1 MAG: hypothetical protein UX01_C0008G0030 [Candidatus Collierbacteria bacterium GW2011_GWB2_45_17]KKU05077.1 MAG: hypothetical protein UX08_C0011G0003 [Candidatus Collierbacte